ncbi:MAG: DNA primase [Thiohalomonadaceae bacterium]
MAGRIPQHFIDDLVSRIDIVEVIDKRVPLKKAGRDYQACCPFHSEKTPSFTVSPEKQFYHCFGCGAHGTAIGFLMEYERMEFVEAIEELAQQAGVTVVREDEHGRPADAPRGDGNKALYAVLTQAADYYRQQLRSHPDAPRVIAYLKERGMSGEIARDFLIGYAPNGWDNLSKALGSQQEHALVQAGMLVEKEGGNRYDRFRDRLMFPIRDRRGRVIAFGGRVLPGADDKAAGAKYLNSPETPVFHKGNELYGLFEARQALRELPRLLVVEGYMDVVALAQHGVRYAVATLGTAVTVEHIEKLFRQSSEVVFCFDGDRAGRDAAWRGLENALPLMRDDRSLRFMFMPDGEDPDTLIRSIGQEAFEAQVRDAQSMDEFLIEQFKQRVDVRQIDGQARLVEMSRPMLGKLPPGVYRHKLLERLASLAQMPLAALEGMLQGKTAQETNRAAPSGQPQFSRAKAGRQSPSQVRHAISLLLQHPELARQVANPDALAPLQQPGIALLVEMLDLLQREPNLNTPALLEHWRGRDEAPHLFSLARQDMLLNAEQDDLADEFNGAIRGLQQQLLRQRHRQLSSKPLAELSSAERLEYQSLLREMQN